MVLAALALVGANSPLAPSYFGLFHADVLGLSVLHWINDALMALFFLRVGLEIKRELLVGELSTGPQRVLPGIAALGGMVAPALIYAALNAAGPRRCAAGRYRPRPISRSRSAFSRCSDRACRYRSRSSSPRWHSWTISAPLR
jgi:hypothetical protein